MGWLWGLAACFGLITLPLMADAPLLILDPLQAAGLGTGWGIDPAKGAHRMTVAGAVMPGDIPIPAVFRYNASYNASFASEGENVSVWTALTNDLDASHFGLTDKAATSVLVNSNGILPTNTAPLAESGNGYRTFTTGTTGFRTVSALNARGNGAQFQWAEPSAGSCAASLVLARRYYIGIQVPSFPITGYSGLAITVPEFHPELKSPTRLRTTASHFNATCSPPTIPRANSRVRSSICIEGGRMGT